MVEAPALVAGVAVAAGAAGWDGAVEDEHAGRAAASASFKAQIEGRRGCSMPWRTSIPRAAANSGERRTVREPSAGARDREALLPL